MRERGSSYGVICQPGGLQKGRRCSTNRYISRVFLYGVRISVPTLALLFTSKPSSEGLAESYQNY